METWPRQAACSGNDCLQLAGAQRGPLGLSTGWIIILPRSNQILACQPHCLHLEVLTLPLLFPWGLPAAAAAERTLGQAMGRTDKAVCSRRGLLGSNLVKLHWSASEARWPPKRRGSEKWAESGSLTEREKRGATKENGSYMGWKSKKKIQLGLKSCWEWGQRWRTKLSIWVRFSSRDFYMHLGFWEAKQDPLGADTAQTLYSDLLNWSPYWVSMWWSKQGLPKLFTDCIYVIYNEGWE